MKVGSDSISIPKWLEVLLSEKFFNSCLVHEFERKNDENTFCLDCCLSLCIHCLPSHDQSHKLLRIRRYVHQDVLRLKEANKLLDCSFVQSYTTNKAKVVFLNQRPINRQLIKGSINYYCIACHKSLKHPNLFCSISCKVQNMVNCSNDNLIIKYQNFTSRCESSVELVEDQKTPDFTISTSSKHTFLDASTSSLVSDGSFAHRRKGVPQRSPLC